MKYWNPFIFLPLFLSIPSFANDALQQSWQQLVNTNPKLASAQSAVSAQQQALKAQYWAFGPQASLDARYTKLDQALSISVDLSAINPMLPPMTETIQDIEFGSAQVKIIQPLFTGGRLSQAVRAERAELDIKTAEAALEQQQMFTQFIERFLNAQISQQVVDIRQRALDNLVQHKAKAINSEKQGLISRLQRLAVEVEYEKSRNEWLQAGLDAQLAVQAFHALFKQGVSIPDYQPQPLSADVIDILAEAAPRLTQHPGIAKLNALQQKASASAWATAGGYLPQVTAFTSLELLPEQLSALQPDWSVGIDLHWQILGQKNRLHSIAQAHGQMQQAAYEQQQVQQDLSLLWTQQINRLQHAQQSLQQLEYSKQLATENLQLQRKAVDAGLATALELADAELAAMAISLQQQQIIQQQHRALAELCALINDFNLYFTLSGAYQ